MNDRVPPLSEFPATSPCLKVCLLDVGQECRGCRRTLAEIGAWSRMTLDERRAVNQRLGFRGLLAKPFPLRMLGETIAKALR